jgi:hypothetical protein
MNRQEITAELSDLLEKYLDPHHDLRIYWSHEVTFDYGTNNQIRVDYMKFKPVNGSVSGIEKGDFYCFEVKSSVEDFRSKNGHNFIGDYNYYVMPQEVYDAIRCEIPHSVGVLVSKEHTHLAAIKKPCRRDRTRPVSEMLLMMWRSSRRELVKAAKGK